MGGHLPAAYAQVSRPALQGHARAAPAQRQPARRGADAVQRARLRRAVRREAARAFGPVDIADKGFLRARAMARPVPGSGTLQRLYSMQTLWGSTWAKLARSMSSRTAARLRYLPALELGVGKRKGGSV